ncbi:MAG: sigma-54-dependent Fis family transcriptional regulator [Nitrospinae bacterium RIFCSPLOWO2_12_FULL_47_7]|nr:MAG: sigma-54-dependent Fis family transcriptional regulator [Nitrospinae bacterium RIFCSPLOWO2_12_FULL_47_7]
MNPEILIIEDEEEMRIALTEVLIRNGYSVHTAPNGIEGLELLNKSPFNMVITDVKMPKISGLEVLKEIKKQSPQIPVIMITAYGTIDNAVEAMKEGAFDYILKPFSAEILDEAVLRAIRSQKGKNADSSVIVTPLPTDTLKIVTNNLLMKKVIDMALSVAYSSSTILIQGESGTGKEMLAKFIHQNSNRKDKPFVAVNCAALPKDLLESELFGHERGAFTGAINRKIGKFELANHGSILLDEISEMDMSLQAKLLRVLQEREVDRVGGREPVPIDVRVIATTNRNLREAIDEGEFRDDLYFRLNVIPILIPPLRNRKEDISLLIEYFIKKHSSKNRKNVTGMAKDALLMLTDYYWRGNVRELENVIERAVLLCKGNLITQEYLFMEAIVEEINSSVKAGVTVREMEKKLIFNTLEQVNGNRTKAAELLGVSIRTLRNKLNEYKNEEGFNAY